MTMQSYEASGMRPETIEGWSERADSCAQCARLGSLGHLEAAEDPDELVKQPAAAADHEEPGHHREQVVGPQEQQREDQDHEHEDRLEPEHRPGTELPHAPRADQHEDREDHDAAGRGVGTPDAERAVDEHDDQVAT